MKGCSRRTEIILAVIALILCYAVLRTSNKPNSPPTLTARAKETGVITSKSTPANTTKTLIPTLTPVKSRIATPLTNTPPPKLAGSFPISTPIPTNTLKITPTPELIETLGAGLRASPSFTPAKVISPSLQATQTPTQSRVEIGIFFPLLAFVGLYLLIVPVSVAGFYLGIRTKAKQAKHQIGQVQIRHQEEIQEIQSVYLKEAGKIADQLRMKHQQEIQEIQSVNMAKLEEARMGEKQLLMKHQQEIQEILSASLAKLEEVRMKKWLAKMRYSPWKEKAPEIEIEVKFVFQLLQYLGYEENEMELRTSVSMQEGSTKTSKEADWVIRDRAGNVLMVVEAKAPNNISLEDAKEQARSYAFWLKAPVYIATNGEQLEIYHRRVIDERCVLSCHISQIGENWEAIKEVASKSSVIAIREKLMN